MASHECETYKFPVLSGNFDLLISKTYAGNGRVQAIKDAYADARKTAEKEGEDAMKDETCDRPCQRFIYVEPSIEKMEITKDDPGNIVCNFTGTWKAGILCVKLGKHPAKK